MLKHREDWEKDSIIGLIGRAIPDLKVKRRPDNDIVLF